LLNPPTRHRPQTNGSVIDIGAVQGRGEPLICFSHLRWDFVFQRPQHLMTRFAKSRRVFIFEEPVAAEPGEGPSLDLRKDGDSDVMIATPRLPAGLDGFGRDVIVRQLLDEMVAEQKIVAPVLWYYTPMMLSFSRHLDASAVIYDCMDELANFKFAPSELKELERELMARADAVFTGGWSLYEAKKDQHRNIHPFPSSVDRAHFAKARAAAADPAELAGAPHPRLGFYGVIDERLDLDLLASVADARPNWTLVMVGPVVKISPDDLPRRANILYPGAKSYDALPGWLGAWDVALMPFALNESTRFISPTKTPEYLSGGRPVVSTAITDVIRHYGDLEAVKIADTPQAFVAACEQALALAADPAGRWLSEVDKTLAELSWDQTQLRMSALVDKAVAANTSPQPAAPVVSVAAPVVRASNRKRPYDYLIVGAGFAGSVIAERLARGSGKKVMLVDRRPHIGGNAYDHKDAAGLLVHKYGPHIFHTNSADIFEYLSRFTEWRPYEHRVLADVDGKLVPMPINRTTINALYGLDLKSDEQAEAFLKSRAEPIEVIKTSRDQVVSQVGRELYETFFQGYTRKQWGMDPSELDKAVAARVPARFNTDDRYFTDSFQAMPKAGYTAMFENLTDHANIDIQTGVEFEDVRGDLTYDRLVFTGPIDEYFDHRYGELPYRSLRFRHETVDQEWFQPVGVVNYPAEETPFTRITEYKHLTGQVHAKTSITYEFPSAEGDPYYPVPRPENQALFKKYEALANQTPDTTFVGRLATYRYYNMDQVTGQALAAWRRIAERDGRKTALDEDKLGKAAVAI
jgi:UDP-galactopyranose mutase